MSTLGDAAAGKTKCSETIEGPMSNYPIQAVQSPRRTSSVSSDVLNEENISSISSLEDEESLQFFLSDPILSKDEDSDSDSTGASYTTPEDALTLEVPTELNSDEDLIDMAGHHYKLRNLHALIYKNSVTAYLDHGNLLVRHPSYDGRPQAIQPSEIQRIANAISDKNDKSTQTQAYRYIECYNILQRICNNIQHLQQKNFCSDNISLLCVSQRRLEVAELYGVDVPRIVKLCSEMKKYIGKVFELSEDTSLLDEFYLSPKVLHSLGEKRPADQHRASLRGDDVAFKNPYQNLSLNSSDDSLDLAPSPRAARHETHKQEDLASFKGESFVQPNIESLVSISPGAFYYPTTATPLTEWSSKGTQQEDINSELLPKPVSTIQHGEFKKESKRGERMSVSSEIRGESQEGESQEEKPGGRELGGRELGGRELGGRELGGRELGGRELGGRELGGRELGWRRLGGIELGGRRPGGPKPDKRTRRMKKALREREDRGLQKKEPLILTLLWDLVNNLHNIATCLGEVQTGEHVFKSYTILRALDLMIISYAGAHTLEPMLPGEQQDWRYLHINGRNISYDTENHTNEGSIIATRRKPKCLDGFFSGQKLWVFHTGYQPNDQVSLYISAYKKVFADIWGPMWEISTSRNPEAVLRYDLEKGSIVPSQTPPGGWDIVLYTYEIPCHWISNHDLSIWEAANAAREPPTMNKNWSLVIGGSHQIRLIENIKLCHCDSARLKTDFSNSGYLRTPGTSEARRKTDAETFSATIGSGAPGVVFGYSRSTKIIAGRSWKESLLKRWTHEKTTRNPHTLMQYRGIEISHCTSHSRRIRLVDVLGTKTMSRWLSTINPVKIPEAAVRIDQMLRSSPAQLVECYINEPAMREDIGDLVGACLNILFETGCTAESATMLSAFWMFANDEFLIKYPPNQFEWSGLVQDSDSNCAFVVLEEKCLIFSLGRGCQYPSSDSQGSNQFDPIFETRLIINDQIKLPEGLVLHRSSKSSRWKVGHIKKGYFRIGDNGSLKVTSPISNRHLLLRWSNELPFISSGRSLATRILSSEPAKFHREYISDDADRNLAPVRIFVI
jgi:hypothetical protein